MKLDRLAATALFSQGAIPVLVFGFPWPIGLFLVAVAVSYALVAWGLWFSKRWALIAALIFTAPQLFVVSSELFSWDFFIGGAFGAGFATASSLMDCRIASFYSFGARCDIAVFKHSPSILANFRYVQSETFVLVNVVSVLIFALLLGCLRRQARISTSPSALTVASSGPDTQSVLKGGGS